MYGRFARHSPVEDFAAKGGSQNNLVPSERIAIQGRVESLVILAGRGFGTTLREIARLPIPDILMQ
jgi:hypothetical protein